MVGNRKHRRKPLQRIVFNTRRVNYKSETVTHLRITSYPHTTRPEDRPFPEYSDRRKYVRPLHARVPFLRTAAHGTHRNMKLIMELRSAAQIKISGINYTPIVKKQPVSAQE